MNTVVIGAGLSGLACAGELQSRGEGVLLLDKSRGVSGRSATRRVAGGAADHGARYFTARFPRLQALCRQGEREGWLTAWVHGLARLDANGELHPGEDGHPRWVPREGMAALGKRLAAGLTVRRETPVQALERVEGGWRLHLPGDTLTARRVVLALPAPQALALLPAGALLPDGADLAGFRAALAAVRYDPCWTLVVRAELPSTPWRGLHVTGSALEWLAREDSKRPGPGLLVAQAGGEWSRERLELPPAEAEPRLRGELAGVLARLGLSPELGEGFAHRWRYATPLSRHPEAYVYAPELGLGFCGDGCTPDPHGPRVEAALRSGWALGSSSGLGAALS